MVRSTFLPTISELRAFEAVARLRSISGAAAELSCSQPTVTYRIRELEERWSVELFSRTTRTLEWTETTHCFYTRVRSVLLEIENISMQIQNAAINQLRVSVAPSFASTWLVPRLNMFNQQYPEIDLQVSATNRFVDLGREAIDVAIRLIQHGTALDGDLITYPLMEDERLIVACSADYAARWRGAPDVGNLARATLLWEENTNNWMRFFQTYLGDVKPLAGPSFNNGDLIIKSAIAHQGICIIRELLVVDAIQQGHLVQIFPDSIACLDSYLIVMQRRNVDTRKGTDFVQWMQKQVAACFAASPRRALSR